MYVDLKSSLINLTKSRHFEVDKNSTSIVIKSVKCRVKTKWWTKVVKKLPKSSKNLSKSSKKSIQK